MCQTKQDMACLIVTLMVGDDGLVPVADAVRGGGVIARCEPSKMWWEGSIAGRTWTLAVRVVRSLNAT
jgi:hypothetical protein